jgi:Flp pilus assembly protein TadG
MPRMLRNDRGQTVVEFAAVLPLLVVLLLAIIQFGIAFNHYVTLTDAARAGARKAIVARLAGGTTADAEQVVRDAAGSLDQAKLTVKVSSTDWTKSGSEVQVQATYPYSIDLLGWVVASGDLKSTMKERLE